MIPVILINFVDLFVLCFNFLLLVRVVLSWFLTPQTSRPMSFLYELTEPLLYPIRRVLLQGQVVDWAPLMMFFLLQGLQYGVHYLAARLG